MGWFTDTTPLIIAHRGASAHSPENTLAAFSLAADLGADGLELDVQLSADGQPVIIHDARVNRITNGSGTVSEMSLAELQALDAGDEQAIPTLDELFDLLGKQILYNIEIKSFSWGDRGVEAAVASCVRSHQLENEVIVSSFSPWSVRRARSHLADRTPVALIRAPGLLQYGCWLAKGEADHPHFSLVSERYMRWAKKEGYRVHVWTVDEPAEARRLAVLGVHALITNKPDLIRSSLAE